MFSIPPGLFAAIFPLLGMASVAMHKPALGVFFDDPSTAVTATSVASGLITLVAGALKGFETPAAK